MVGSSTPVSTRPADPRYRRVAPGPGLSYSTSASALSARIAPEDRDSGRPMGSVSTTASDTDDLAADAIHPSSPRRTVGFRARSAGHRFELWPFDQELPSRTTLSVESGRATE